MTIAFWCVFITVLMPYLLTGTVKASSGTFGNQANRDPRRWQGELTGWRKRLHYAHQNSFEAMPVFSTIVIMGHILEANQQRMDMLAVGFVLCRIGYAVCYAADMARTRTAFWSLAVLCVLGIFISSL